MVRSESTSADDTSRDNIGTEIDALRADVAAIAATLRKYGALGAEEVKARAQGFSDEAVAETLRSVKELRHRVDSLQGQLEGEVRAHPLVWLAGALGLGLLFGLVSAHRR